MSVRPKTERLPPLVTHLLRTAAVGAFLGSFLALGFILTNAAGLGRLIAESATPVPALLLLFIGFTTLIGGLYTAASIMMMPRDKSDELWRTLSDT